MTEPSTTTSRLAAERRFAIEAVVSAACLTKAVRDDFDPAAEAVSKADTSPVTVADLGAQGYFRPFTVDEEQSIGVTFPGRPAIRAVVCRYDRYLGEPFSGVVVPHLVRAIDINQMGCLKLGVNYLVSVKAVDEARKIDPSAGSALFLDDKPDLGLMERKITEWDSSVRPP